MNLVIDNVPITLNMNTHFDEVVYKNSGGGGAGGAQLGTQKPNSWKSCINCSC